MYRQLTKNVNYRNSLLHIFCLTHFYQTFEENKPNHSTKFQLSHAQEITKTL